MLNALHSPAGGANVWRVPVGHPRNVCLYRKGATLHQRPGVAPPTVPTIAKSAWHGPRIGPYIPLAAALAVIPWTLILTMGLLFMVGDTPYESTPAKERVFAALAVLPAAVGLLGGVAAVVGRWARRGVEWVGLGLGCLVCGALLYAGVAEWIG